MFGSMTLKIAALAGALTGLIFGFVISHHYMGLSEWLNEQTTDALLWTSAGATLGVSIAWLVKLTRA